VMLPKRIVAVVKIKILALLGFQQAILFKSNTLN